MLRRILLFFALNALVVLMVSIILNVLNIRPYLSAYGMDYSSLLTFCLLWGMVGALVSLAMSRQIAKWMLRVSVIEPLNPHYKDLIESIRVLSKRAGIPMPQVGVYPSSEVNAFATGPTKSRSLVAVSTGLLSKMGRRELEGILGHEITHIANGDMVTMTLLQGVINAFVMFLARILASLLSGFGRGRDSRGGSAMSYFLFTLLFESIFMSLGFMAVAAFSRYREFKADAGGARLAGKDAMISALQALQGMNGSDEDQKMVAALKISSKVRKGTFARYFSTHPPLDERIKRLQAL
jgi:heat shock protein HtpX